MIQMASKTTPGTTQAVSLKSMRLSSAVAVAEVLATVVVVVRVPLWNSQITQSQSLALDLPLAAEALELSGAQPPTLVARVFTPSLRALEESVAVLESMARQAT
jgi:hypothetical protein